jgi:hypothetical protein
VWLFSYDILKPHSDAAYTPSSPEGWSEEIGAFAILPLPFSKLDPAPSLAGSALVAKPVAKSVTTTVKGIRLQRLLPAPHFTARPG